MSLYQFKKGDRVIFMPKESGRIFSQHIGKVLTLKSTYGTSQWHVEEIASPFCPQSSSLIPEAIYNSPLAEALK